MLQTLSYIYQTESHTVTNKELEEEGEKLIHC